MKAKLMRVQKEPSKRIKFDLQLHVPEKDKFLAVIGGRFAVLANLGDQSIEDMNEAANTALLETAEDALGRKRKKNNEWVTGEIHDLCDQRIKFKPHRNKNEATMEKY